ncbi:Dehydrocurvularin biosynthesis regulator [Cladobotryum mycophilum]|uniref:Dehydrocurvularin biosynthesis regulator n=1 Tax=Cladobotryum mycophilum TaxID=491253 RepID=A0ABR0S9T5_9HYPO
MKCVFDPVTHATTCNGCRRRGSPCISQEFPEDTSPSANESHKTRDGVGRVGTLSSGSHDTIQNEAPSPACEGGTRAQPYIPVTPTSEPSPQIVSHKAAAEQRTVNHDTRQSSSHTPAPQGKYERLSRLLYESLPSPEDVGRIWKACPRSSILAHEIMTMPYSSLMQDDLERPDRLLEIPKPDSHPVLIARHMLLLASFLQHLHPDLHEEVKHLSEPPRVMSERLADLANSLVTTKDELLGSIEGLECVMIESVYHANIGNLRRSWVSCRRALSIAQLMGLHRSDNRTQYKVLDSKTNCQPQTMWFRIVFLDRFLCLMLGLPQGCNDRRMSSDAMLTKDLPLERLERIHFIVASRILERNESDPSANDLPLTRTLDLELQKAARSVPSKWWLTPKMDGTQTNSQALFLNTRRLFAQVLHYNLLNQLHLPYMLRSSSTGRKYEYSRITCVNASREVLTRFIALRSFNGIAYSCRIIDFIALMAAMTLLLAHLDSNPLDTENLLAHQYHSDRAMIEQVQENMGEVSHLNSETLNLQSANLLRRLLAIETEATEGCPSYTGRVTVDEAGTDSTPPTQDSDAVVSVHIPYFGVIKIAREDVSAKRPEAQSTTATTGRLAQLQVVNKSRAPNTQNPHLASQMRLFEPTKPSRNLNFGVITPVDSDYGHVETLSSMSDACANTPIYHGTLSIEAAGADHFDSHFAMQLHNSPSDPLLQHDQHLGLAAGSEDWAFQGADLAFFDSLMRGTGNEGNRGA